MGFTPTASAVILALLPISNILGRTTTISAITTTDSSTTSESNIGHFRRTKGVGAKLCPVGVYDSTTGTVTFKLTEAQCEVIMQMDKTPKKSRTERKPSKTSTSVRQERRGKMKEKGKRQRKGVVIVSRTTGKGSKSECLQATTDFVSNRGFIVKVGMCELIAIQKENMKASRESLSLMIISRTRVV